MVYFIPASDRDHRNAAQRRNRADDVGSVGADLGVRPGESDSTPMVGGVLLLVLATISIVLVSGWWLV
jgi:hypothetical protein